METWDCHSFSNVQNTIGIFFLKQTSADTA
eukprot:SAG31_NODE_15740_length_740_cov_1.831513_1_plen_29_part_10